MDIKKLTSEERSALLSELKAEQEKERADKKARQEEYEAFKDTFVRENIVKLEALSAEMERVRKEVFGDAKAVIDLKNELYKTKSDRNSDTLSTADGKMKIALGCRTYEDWDDTLDVGVQKVKEFLKTLAKDDNSAVLVDAVMRLLSKDRKGNLKASKVLELEKIANKIGDEGFIEAIGIIRAAYRPVPSCQFIEASVRDEDGNENHIPLSLAALKEKKKNDKKEEV
jgi:ribosomal protein L29